MNRKYMSGAEKRKLATKKQEKENEVIKKVPKINELFSVIGSTSTSQSSATESVNDEIELPHDENVMECIESMEIEAETIDIGRTFEFPADAALWNIEDNITSLQNYWIRKGNVKGGYVLKLKRNVHYFQIISFRTIVMP